MKPFDITTATDDEIVAEAERRWAERNGTRPAPQPLEWGDLTPKIPAPKFDQVRLDLPFNLLVSDNERSIPVVWRRGKNVYPRLVLNPKYKKAKLAIQKHIRRQLPEGFVPFTGRCHITLIIHEPDRRRVRDINNWWKQVGDAMSKLVFIDDGQIDDARAVRDTVEETACVTIIVTEIR